MEYLRTFIRYRGLVSELVSRDIKVKYRRSVLGYVWTVLSPLMMMAVIAVVFSYFFRYEIENYAVYLLAGQLVFNFFNESTTNAMSSIINNRSLICKVHVPKYVFPLSRVMSAFVNLMFSLAAILIMLIITRAPLHWTILLFPLPLIYLFFIALGIGLILSVLAVFFRDVLHIYSVVITALMYFTPIFYPVSILPDYAMKIMKFNPLYHIVEMFRGYVIYGTLASAGEHLICIAFGLGFTAIGLLLFKRKQDNFLMYI